MPPTTRTYYRHYDSSDTTSIAYGNIGGTFAYISDLDGSPPSGKIFKEWNTETDGTGEAFEEGGGDSLHEPVYTVYAIWEDLIPYLTNDTDLTNIADAIRTKAGISEALEGPNGFISAIEAIGREIELYSVINNAEHLGISSDKSSASAGDTITITTTAILKPTGHIYVGTTSDSSDIAAFSAPSGSWNGATVSFVMPSSNVYIHAGK